MIYCRISLKEELHDAYFMYYNYNLMILMKEAAKDRDRERAPRNGRPHFNVLYFLEEVISMR